MSVFQGDALPCWFWSSELIYVVSCLWRGPHSKELRKTFHWQPERNWGPHPDSLQGILPITMWPWKWLLPQMNLWWDSHSDQHLNFSLTKDLVKPGAFSSAGAWVSLGSYSNKCTTQNCWGVNAHRATTEQWAKQNMLLPFLLQKCIPQSSSGGPKKWVPEIHSTCQLDNASLHWPSFFFCFNLPIPDPQKPWESKYVSF